VRSLTTGLLIVVLGSWVLWNATDGARTFTSEGARRLSVRSHPRPVPPVLLQDQTGSQLNMQDLRGRLVVVDFIYTRCHTLCAVMSGTLATLRDDLPTAQLGKDVVLLSISFDPEHDTVKTLKEYGARYDALPGNWHISRVVHSTALPKLLHTFGITVIPNGMGGFKHNAAIHVIDKQGRLARIVGYDDPKAAIAAVEDLLK